MQLLMAKSIIYAKLNNVEAIRKCVHEAIEIIAVKPKPSEIISSINYLASLMGSCLRMGLKAESDLLLNKVYQLDIKTPKIKFYKQNVFLQMLLFYANITQDNSRVLPHLAELKTFLSKNLKQDKVSNLLKQTLMYFFMQKQYEHCIDIAQMCLNKNKNLPPEHHEYLNVWLPYIISHIELCNYDLALNLTQNVYRTLKRHKLVGEKKRPILLAIQRFLKSKHTYNDYLKLQIVFNQYEFWRFLQVWVNEKIILLENTPNKLQVTKNLFL